MKRFGLSRRDFLKSSAALSAAAVIPQPASLFAAGSDTIKVALVGCGGRGNGALQNCIDAAKQVNLNLKIVALADHFRDKALKTATEHQLSEDICFDGPSAYKKVMATDADIVMLVTPPVFRPVHFDAAVKAGKNVFMEKPVAVDPPGARKIIESGKLAREKGLSVVAGTQRRYQASYRKTHYAIQNGAIGKLRSASIYWCMNHMWYKTRNPGESDADYMIRNWNNFTEMSGDHIVEQHLHQIDVANWFFGRTPKSALGFGGRARRKTGNQFDFFSVEFDYEDGRRVHSMCRQVDGCYGLVSEFFTGANASTFADNLDKSIDASNIKFPDFPQSPGGELVQEHVELLQAVTKGKPVNAAGDVAESTLTAIMGRISAYTGQLVRFSELTDPALKSPWYDLTLKPTAEDFETGSVVAPAEDSVPVPGQDAV